MAELMMVESTCSVCGMRTSGNLVATGRDFEYGTSQHDYKMYLCTRCDAMFLNPRPGKSELSGRYPEKSHAFQFTDDELGLSQVMRRRAERRRLFQLCKSVRSGGSIGVVGAGDGFHMRTLREHGDPSWNLTAVEPNPQVAAALRREGCEVHEGSLEELNLRPDQFDFVVMIMVIEHADDPLKLMREVRRVLRPGGRVGIVTDNIRSIDALFGRKRHWGGYHFPRHFNLYSRKSIGLLANRAGLDLELVTTAVSPVNWMYTLRNRLADRGSQKWSRRFSLRSSWAFAVFTMVDTLARALGRGALLRAVLVKK